MQHLNTRGINSFADHGPAVILMSSTSGGYILGNSIVLSVFLVVCAFSTTEWFYECLYVGWLISHFFKKQRLYLTAFLFVFPGKGILKDTIILKVDGAVRVITMQIITPASMIMEVCLEIVVISRGLSNTSCDHTAMYKSWSGRRIKITFSLTGLCFYPKSQSNWERL